MLIISHRGNLNGPNPEVENHPDYIKRALRAGFNVEIDLHVVDGKLYLGHDTPQYFITPDFLLDTSLWVHCKNAAALEYMAHNRVNFDNFPEYFWHEDDRYTITSGGVVWCHRDYTALQDCPAICVLPEHTSQDVHNMKIYGICTDYPYKYSYDI